MGLIIYVGLFSLVYLYRVVTDQSISWCDNPTTILIELLNLAKKALLTGFFYALSFLHCQYLYHNRLFWKWKKTLVFSLLSSFLWLVLFVVLLQLTSSFLSQLPYLLLPAQVPLWTWIFYSYSMVARILPGSSQKRSEWLMLLMSFSVSDVGQLYQLKRLSRVFLLYIILLSSLVLLLWPVNPVLRSNLDLYGFLVLLVSIWVLLLDQLPWLCVRRVGFPWWINILISIFYINVLILYFSWSGRGALGSFLYISSSNSSSLFNDSSQSLSNHLITADIT